MRQIVAVHLRLRLRLWLENENTVRITILTATLNPGSALSDCLNSVAEQIVPDGISIHHHVLDGGSSDGTLDFLQSWVRDHPGRTFRSGPDGGFYEALNSGIQETQGDIVGILNADDFYFDEQVLADVVHSLKDPNIFGTYGDLVYISSGSDRAQYQVKRYWKAGAFRNFRHGWMPPHPTVFVRREVYDLSGGFRTNFGSAADYEWLIRAIYKAGLSMAYIPRVLVAMREGGMSNRNVKVRLQANWNDQRAWSENQIRPLPWTLLMKPLRKIPQWWQRPPK